MWFLPNAWGCTYVAPASGPLVVSCTCSTSCGSHVEFLLRRNNGRRRACRDFWLSANRGQEWIGGRNVPPETHRGPWCDQWIYRASRGYADFREFRVSED